MVEAVKNEQFFIYQVEDIYQTAKILFDRDLLEEKEEYAKGKEPIALSLIHIYKDRSKQNPVTQIKLEKFNNCATQKHHDRQTYSMAEKWWLKSEITSNNWKNIF